MHIKKTIAIATAAATIGLTSAAGIASAQTSSGTTLADKIAQKFNLNKDDVQKVFDENRSERQAQQEQRYEARLTQAVKDGKLTEDQKSKILAKHKELQAEMEKQRASMKSERAAMENKTDAERKALMEQRRTEMDAQRTAIEKWEKDNGIPAGYLDFRGKGGGPGGRGHGDGNL